MKCKCGNEEFYAHQLCRLTVIVDGNKHFLSNPVRMNPDTGVLEEYWDIYDAETPYGPYECTACGREYDEIVK